MSSFLFCFNGIVNRFGIIKESNAMTGVTQCSMEEGSSPATVSSRRRIVYKKSSWRVHQFEVWSGEMVCRVAALRGDGWLLLWLGGLEPHLSEVALGMPGNNKAGDAAATALMGGDDTAPPLARRLAARLSRPVYVCLGTSFDRFTVPIVERGLILEIKSRPECF